MVRMSDGSMETAARQQSLASFLFTLNPSIGRQLVGSRQRAVHSRRSVFAPQQRATVRSQESSHAVVPEKVDASQAAAETGSQSSHVNELAFPSVSFSHVQAYVDSLKPLKEYKLLERKLHAFAKDAPKGIELGRKKWLELSEIYDEPVVGIKDPAAWVGYGQDVVEQLLVGLGWRITGEYTGLNTTSLVVSSPATDGAKFVFTARNKKPSDGTLSAKSEPDHFSSENVERFAEHRSGREGFAVLAFNVAPGGLEIIRNRYAHMHPKLLLHDVPKEYNGFKVLDVFAYYQGEIGQSDEDRGTLIRFVEPQQDSPDILALPGIEKVEAVFDEFTLPVYCDHWVSNVMSRTGFIDVLSDTLGFTPKVDFNAGVVAAGEAQIESTVAGNDPGKHMDDENAALKSQAQVYLPINNAISQVGHVHGYLDEIGQGIQHIASRVSDLPSLVQRANDMREITGAGLSFLSIPPSYYGSLNKDRMVQELEMDVGTAEMHVRALKEAGVVSASDIVDVDVRREQVADSLPEDVSPETIEYIMRARYSNLYALLRDSIDEDTYLSIVRNQILVDVQGGDLLMQIFTAPVLQREAGQEAPFFEFIQRVCSTKKDPSSGKQMPIKPGCGGFGIRNFLTLFLSIEVSKAAKLREDAVLDGRHDVADYYANMVDTFARQLEESNPVLTFISDAMTEEGEALARGDEITAKRHKLDKESGQRSLMTISTKYKNIMREMRKRAPIP